MDKDSKYKDIKGTILIWHNLILPCIIALLIVFTADIDSILEMIFGFFGIIISLELYFCLPTYAMVKDKEINNLKDCFKFIFKLLISDIIIIGIFYLLSLLQCSSSRYDGEPEYWEWATRHL